MDEVIFELSIEGNWRVVGSQAEIEPPGSLSSDEPSGRQVYMFGWIDGVAGVWRSLAGADVQNGAFRAVHALALERLAALVEGPYEREVWMAAGRFQARWRLQEANHG